MHRAGPPEGGYRYNLGVAAFFGDMRFSRRRHGFVNQIVDTEGRFG